MDGEAVDQAEVDRHVNRGASKWRGASGIVRRFRHKEKMRTFQSGLV